MMNTQPQYKLGDVVRDSYDNPAVVLNVQPHYLTIMQTVGSDLGNVTTRNIYPYGRQHGAVKIMTGERADAARERARVEWRKRPAYYRRVVS